MRNDEKRICLPETGGRPDTAVLPPPDKKATGLVTITASLLFLAACLYTIVSALSGPGKSDGTMRIEHIRLLDLRPENNTHPSKQLLR